MARSRLGEEMASYNSMNWNGLVNPSGRPAQVDKNNCDCGMRLLHEDILALVHGEILNCGHCNSLIWFDETFWDGKDSMEYHYIRWTKPNGVPPLKISIWMLRALLAEDFPCQKSIQE